MWLKEGDRNTRYFHCRANQRNRHNLILGLEYETGNWVEDEGQMGKVVQDYFESMFTSSNPSGYDEILEGMQPAISDASPLKLGRDFQADEVHNTLKQMGPLIAPSPDGMFPIFYKTYWNIVGEDVTVVVLNALNTGIIPGAINTTFICLIPKIKNPKKVLDFRPISLCNVIYKLIAKVVVNRLKRFLATIIPDSQSAFLSGRLITNNVLVAFETLHYLKRKTQGKMGLMALKLDMSKAYDRVEWAFLERVMYQLGLEERLIKIIMSCVQSVSYYVLLNGQPVGNIIPGRGFRQGDPLSPYLFLLCAMGLQCLIQKAEASGDIKGVAICHNKPRISHLFFADDNVLFCRATKGECQKILDILAIYEHGSGPKINREKTNLFFNSNTPPQIETSIQQLLRVPTIR